MAPSCIGLGMYVLDRELSALVLVRCGPQSLLVPGVFSKSVSGLCVQGERCGFSGPL